MTKFNHYNKEMLTYGECLNPIFKIVDKADAMQYKEAYIKYIEKFLINGVNESGMSAEQIVNENIGYFAGYGTEVDRYRIEDLFECAHPIFGELKTNGSPTAQEAFICGKTGRTITDLRNLISL